MKKLIILFCCLPFFLFGQSGFNSWYSVDSTSTGFHGVISSGSDLLVSASTFNEEKWEWDLNVLQLDTLGHVINAYQKTGEYGYHMVGSKLISISDGESLLISNMQGATRGAIVKLDENLEEVFYKEINSPGNQTTLYKEAVEVSDGYVIGGEVQHQNYDEWAWASKLDYEGNVVWYQEYGSPSLDTLENVFDMAVTVDGNVMIAGFQTWPIGSGPEPLYASRPWLLIIDNETGEIIWERKYDRYAEERVAFSIESLEDGSYLSGGSYFIGKVDGYPFYSIDIRRLDANGDLIWRKPLGPVIKPTEQFVFDILPLPDGRYAAIAQGNLGIDFSPLWQNRAAITIVFDPEDGTESWTRVDTIPSDTIDNKSNYVQGGTVLSTGSIVVAGYNNAPPTKGWLLKMDKNGCIQEDCVMTATVEIPGQQPTAPVLYPNPVRDYLHLDGEVHSDLWIEDMQGRLLRIIPRAKTAEAIDVQGLPAGVYLLRGKTDGVAWVLKWVRS